MKYVCALLLSLSLHSAIMAQGGWKVSLNDKTILKTSVEDEQKNIRTIKAADLKKKKDLVVSYTEQQKENNWERMIMLYDENDQELSQQKGTRFKISNATLQSFFRKSKKLSVYTWALPTDPKLKAAIRVRRVHLCTLILQ